MALDTLASLAGGARALAQAERLATSGALSHLRCEDGGPRLTGRWQGTGETPYRISVELGRRPTRHACTCPSRQRPCKHVLALLARWARTPGAFERHGQLDAFAVATSDVEAHERQSSHGRALPRADAERLGCIRRHRERQALGLQRAEQLLVRWVSEGLMRLDATTLQETNAQLDDLEGLQVSGVAAQLRALLHLALEPGERAEAKDAALAAELGRAWTRIRRGLAWVRNPESFGGDAGETAWQEEAALQSALGRRWTPAELRLLQTERDLTLVELAWRRSEDPGLRARVEASLLYDLDGAGWLAERKVTPWSRLGHARPKASYPDPLQVQAAQCWPATRARPDAACRRVRWSAGAAQSRPGSASDWAKLRDAAQPLSALLTRHAAFRAAPWHAPVVHPELLQLQSMERAGGHLWACDPSGDRYRLEGPAEALATLTFLGLPRDASAAVVEVREGPAVEAPTLSLLALITPRGPVRLAG